MEISICRGIHYVTFGAATLRSVLFVYMEDHGRPLMQLMDGAISVRVFPKNIIYIIFFCGCSTGAALMLEALFAELKKAGRL